MDALEAIFARRSVGRLGSPGPSEEELHTILRAAAAAPDHLSLRPLRLVVLQGESKDEFGEVLAAGYLARCRDSGEEVVPAKLEKERTKLGRAPVVVIVGAAETTGGRIPYLEQQLAAGAAAENALLAATALGYGSMWRTGDAAYDETVKAAVGLEEWESIVGFLYLGTAASPPEPHDPDLDGLVRTWAP